jgi:hypothetical protein
MSNETYCTPAGGVDSLPGLDNSLYCVTPNTLNAPSFTNMTTVCCDTNALQKMGGCDYCILEQSTPWYNASDANGDDPGTGWSSCLSRQANVFQTNQSLRFSYCHVPSESSAAASIFATSAGGRMGWAVWGLVVMVGVGTVSGSFL